MAASRNPLARLAHIRDEIEQLAVALDVFSGSYVLRRMTEHAILIISEAVKSLPAAMTEPQLGINWRAIATSATYCDTTISRSMSGCCGRWRQSTFAS